MISLKIFQRLKNSLNDFEKREIKSKVGELLWVSLMMRPDLSFEVNNISSGITNATVKTIKDVNNVISRAKSRKDVLKFIPLGDI